MMFIMGLNKWTGLSTFCLVCAFVCLVLLKDRQGIDCRVLLPFEVVYFALMLVCADPGGGDKE